MGRRPDDLRWESIAREYGRYMYAVAYRLSGNQSDAEDVVQEALIRVKRGLVTYQPGSMKGWLGRIVTNVFLDEMRRRKRRPQVKLPDDALLISSEGADVDWAARDLPDHLQAALGQLPPDFRAAVILSDVAGLDYQGIADALDVPIGTVRSRVHRGRSRLRSLLELLDQESRENL